MQGSGHASSFVDIVLRNAVLAVIMGMLHACSDRLPDEVAKAYDKLPQEIDFNFHVRPILSDRCYPCHGPDENARKADLRLDQQEAVFAGLKDSREFAVVPGKPHQSMLIDRILDADAERTMPPPDSKLRLNAEEKATLVKWIEQGARWKKHWAYIPPAKAPLPGITQVDWPVNEIDYFVLDKLESMGMSPSEEADRRTLIRRLSFDLTGLPPTMKEIRQTAVLLQRIKGSCFESPQHFSVRPLSLPVASGMCDRSKRDLASEGMIILHEGTARELGAVVGNDPCRDSKMTHQIFQEL
jgi:hypothetical protein